MKWSRYAKLFQSERNGWLLYHSATNTFLEVETQAVPLIQEMIENAAEFDATKAVGLYFQLRMGGFLVEDTSDTDFFDWLKTQRLAANAAKSVINLTIAPTRNCNFACSYCYEGNRTKSMMSDETVENLVRFIERHERAQMVNVVWYGGESLLAYPKIKQITAAIGTLGKHFQAMMITNGYLLTPKACRELNALKISILQITLDGEEETHDRRRFLIGGGGTFAQILKNMDTLFASGWSGQLQLRVNVDETNHEQFVKVFRLIQERYDEEIWRRISVYPGFVHDEEGNLTSDCCFDSNRKGAFVARVAQETGIASLPIFPKRVCGGCTMTQQTSYVVGPDGEIYKCWHDVGKPEKAVGKIDSFQYSDVSEEILGSYLEDETCKECFFFPICDGGCPQFRLLNVQDGKKRDNCSYFKAHLEELLEAHYEQKCARKVKVEN